MSRIDDARAEISKIDKQIAELFEKRMSAVKAVAEYKKEYGLPVFDAAREAELLKKNSEYIKSETAASYYVQFQKKVMELSRNYQESLLSGLKVAYCGVSGAYASIAAKKMYKTAELISKDSFADAYAAVQNGECDLCILPLENSYAGEVGTVTELIYSGDLYINQVINISVSHALIGQNGADIEDIKTVISHPQALKQCEEYIKEHNFSCKEASNTAVAAQMIQNSDDKTVAAIASCDTAELYGLKVLDKNIASSANNSTRFAAFSRVANTLQSIGPKPNEHFILVFTVQNRSGALAGALNIIGAHGFNMRTLRSHPKKSLDWEYFFYVEADGNINTENGKDLLRELSAVCAGLKLVGTYYEKAEEIL